MTRTQRLLLLGLATSGLTVFTSALLHTRPAWAADEKKLTDDQKKKLEAKFDMIAKWAANAEVVKAVKECNGDTSDERKNMNQDNWKKMAVTDEFIQKFIKSDAAQWIKKNKDDSTSEAFVSCANGTKAAFLGKTSSWSHKGKPKHDDPMSGKKWTGPIEIDESSGAEQVQISVPVLDGGKPIGSLVVGVRLSKL